MPPSRTRFLLGITFLHLRDNGNYDRPSRCNCQTPVPTTTSGLTIDCTDQETKYDGGLVGEDKHHVPGHYAGHASPAGRKPVAPLSISLCASVSETGQPPIHTGGVAESALHLPRGSTRQPARGSGNRFASHQVANRLRCAAASPSIDWDKGYFTTVLATNSATSPGWRATGTPTSSKVRIFSSAVPLPLEIIAPA